MIEDKYPPEKITDCINHRAMFNWLDENHIDTTSIFKKLGHSRKYLTQAGNMVPMGLSLEVMFAIKESVGQSDPYIFFDIGRESSRLGSFGVLADIGKKLGSIESAFRFVSRFNRKFNDISEIPSSST